MRLCQAAFAIHPEGRLDDPRAAAGALPEPACGVRSVRSVPAAASAARRWRPPPLAPAPGSARKSSRPCSLRSPRTRQAEDSPPPGAQPRGGGVSLTGVGVDSGIAVGDRGRNFFVMGRLNAKLRLSALRPPVSPRSADVVALTRGGHSLLVQCGDGVRLDAPLGLMTPVCGLKRSQGVRMFSPDFRVGARRLATCRARSEGAGR